MPKSAQNKGAPWAATVLIRAPPPPPGPVPPTPKKAFQMQEKCLPLGESFFQSVAESTKSKSICLSNEILVTLSPGFRF